MKPITKYAKNGDISIAYQVVGNGPVDFIYVSGWISNIDILWTDSRISTFLNKISQFSRLILFDKRGTGLSDRVSATCSFEERMNDISTVLNAVGSKKTILFGHSEGCTASSLFAATYPERTVALITFGIFAKRTYSLDYPWAPKPEERELFYQTIRKEWGNGEKMGLEFLMPSLINDKKYYDWFASYLRSGASPGAALALAKMNAEADVIHILETIKVPTLVLHRTGDKDVNIEEGKYIANKITNAKFVELQGNDHFFWVGDTYSVLAEIEEFITGVRPIKRKENLVQNSIIKKTPIISKINIEDVMQNNFQYNLKMSEYAILCGRSLSTFKRDFKNQYVTTPSLWLKDKRLEYARELLLESNLNVNEICFESGFINSSHFIRSFKVKYNLSPNKFKLEYHKE
jgi:pimeloyl-ACP methyl ester carboxylesterase/AraC-like DNA-binding protein